MNRRFFITKALAGLAGVPLIGKLAPPQQNSHQEKILDDGPVAYWRLDELPQPVCQPPRPEDYRTIGYVSTPLEARLHCESLVTYASSRW